MDIIKSKSTQQFDMSESFMANEFLVEHLGIILLIHIQMDSYYKSTKSKRLYSIESLLADFDLGTRIVDKTTEYIAKSLYPKWIYVKDIDDIINLAFNFKDIEFLCDILIAANKHSSELTLSSSNVNNLINLLKNDNPKNVTRGAPIQSEFHKDITHSKLSIIAGTLSAGRKKIKGVKTLIDVQDQTANIIGVSSPTVRKNCYDKKYNADDLTPLIEPVPA